MEKSFKPEALEFFHGKIMEYFHEWRKKQALNNGSGKANVLINGIELNKIIAEAKITTYNEYK